MNVYPSKLLLATTNVKKLNELRGHLEASDIRLIGLQDLAEVPQTVDETGQTFSENAVMKAIGYGRASGMPTLADDSGLEVDALRGRPGVTSARFAGEGASDAENNALLLQEMERVPADKRTARFRCALALFLPGSFDAARLAHLAANATGFSVISSDSAFSGRESSSLGGGWDTTLDTTISDFLILTEGVAQGLILRAPRGEGGFGYDPLFRSNDLGLTFAEAGDTKHRVSHRGRAMQHLVQSLFQPDS